MELNSPKLEHASDKLVLQFTGLIVVSFPPVSIYFFIECWLYSEARAQISWDDY